MFLASFSLLRNENVMARAPASSWEAKKMRGMPREQDGAWVHEDIVGLSLLILTGVREEKQNPL